MKYFLTFIISIVLLFSCAKKNKLEFQVNPSLLGASFQSTDIGFELKIPKNWKRLSESSIQQIKKRLKSKSLQELHLLQSYYRKEKLSTCIISYFDKKKEIEEVIKNYKKRVSYLPDTKVKFGEFYKKDLKFYQFIIDNRFYVTIKLLFITKKQYIVQIDYIVGKNYYAEELKSIESSIGSIKI